MAIDQSMVDPVNFANSGAPALRFPAGLAAGEVIATLRTGRFDHRGGATFSTFGTVPPQLQLVGAQIVKGAGVATVGAIYSVGIRTAGVDADSASEGVTLRIQAT